MAHVEKRGSARWRARYRGPDGRERSKTFDRRADADRWLAGIEMSKARGEWVDPMLGRCTFAAWVDQWAPSLVDLRPATKDRDLRAVRVHLIPYFGDVPLAKITNLMVHRFIADMLAADEHSPSTVRKVGQILAKVMRSAVQAGLIARSPCDGVRLPAETRREMRFLTADQIAALAATVGPEWEVLVYTAAYGGLRWGELAGLHTAQVDLARRTIMVVEQLNELSGELTWGPPKTGAGRRAVAIPATLADLLAEQLARPIVVQSGLIFPSARGQPMRRSHFARRIWAPAIKTLGLDGLRFHDLRHTAVALAISQGAHPKALQERMGHSSVTVTLDRYGHLYEGLDAHIADCLDDLLRNSRGLPAASDPSNDHRIDSSNDIDAGHAWWG